VINVCICSRKKDVGGGSILDLGVYTVHFVDTIFGPGKPESVVCKGTLNTHGTDENMFAILKYAEGQMAVISSHTKVEMDNSAYVYGTNGIIKVMQSYTQSIHFIFFFHFFDLI